LPPQAGDALAGVRSGDPDRDALVSGVVAGPAITGGDPAGHVDAGPQSGDRAGVVLPAEPFDRQAGEERRELGAVPALGGGQLILVSLQILEDLAAVSRADRPTAEPVGPAIRAGGTTRTGSYGGTGGVAVSPGRSW
jgi:hypothetical protein